MTWRAGLRDHPVIAPWAPFIRQRVLLGLGIPDAHLKPSVMAAAGGMPVYASTPG